MPHYVARNDSPGRGDRPRARSLVTLTLVAMALAAAALGATPASAAPRGPDSPADAPRAATPLGGIASKAVRAGVGSTQEIYDPATRKVTLKVDSGFDLDQYLSASSNPLDFQLDLNGFEAPAGESVPLTLRVYDVDQNGAPGFDECAVEVDRVSVNGTPVGQLSGANDQWSIVTMNVPAGVLNDGVNNISIQIDVLTGDCWAVQVDWATLVLPTHIRHVRTDARDDVTIRRGRTDAVIGDTIYRRHFRTDGTLTDPDPDDPIADEFKGAGSFTYRYALDAWPEKPRWAPNVKITWDIKGSGTRSGLIEQSGWENQFRVNLPKKVGKYTLEVTMIILHEDAPFMTEVVKHDLYVVYDKPTGPTQDSFGTAPVTQQPRTAWLDVATEWAQGRSTDTTILSALNASEYGGGNNPLGWHYGYLDPIALPVELIEDGHDRNNDCRAFRDVWRILAASLGIKTVANTYKPGIGFMTTTRPALDNNASANARFAGANAADRWVFGNHQFGTYKGSFYDPTYGLEGPHTVRELERNVYCQAMRTGAPNGLDCVLPVIPAKKVRLTMTGQKNARGWTMWTYGDEVAARRTRAAGAATVTGATDHGDDQDANGLFEELVADVTVNVTSGGDFGVLATLADAGGEIIAVGDLSSDGGRDAPLASVSLAPGSHTLAVRFNGKSIRDAGADGPYTLRVELTDETGASVHVRSSATGAYDHDDFQGALVAIGAVTDHADADALHVDVAATAASRRRRPRRRPAVRRRRARRGCVVDAPRHRGRPVDRPELRRRGDCRRRGRRAVPGVHLDRRRALRGARRAHDRGVRGLVVPSSRPRRSPGRSRTRRSTRTATPRTSAST